MNRIYDRTKTDQVLALLDDIGPMTTQELVLLTKRTSSSVLGSLRRLRNERRAHIAQYLPQDVRGRQQPVYAVGDHPNAVENPATSQQRDKKYRIKMRHVIQARDAVRDGRELNMWRGLL